MSGHNEDNIFVIGDVDDDLEKLTIPIMKQIEEQSELKKGRLDFWINSYGGYMHTADHIVELIELAKREGIIVRTIVPGVAMSAGSYIAVAGTVGERYIAPGAEHLIHYGSVGSFDQTPTQVERSKEWKSRMFKKMISHYEKYCDIPDLKEKMADDAWFIPAKDCLKQKIADKPISKLEVIN